MLTLASKQPGITYLYTKKVFPSAAQPQDPGPEGMQVVDWEMPRPATGGRPCTATRLAVWHLHLCGQPAGVLGTSPCPSVL